MTPPDYMLVCRLCILKNSSYANIFDVNGTLEVRIADIINELLQLNIYPGDGLPEKICCDCLNELARFKRFKNISHEAKLTLESVIRGKKDVTPQPSTSKQENAEKKIIHFVDLAENDDDSEDSAETIAPPSLIALDDFGLDDEITPEKSSKISEICVSKKEEPEREIDDEILLLKDPLESDDSLLESESGSKLVPDDDEADIVELEADDPPFETDIRDMHCSRTLGYERIPKEGKTETAMAAGVKTSPERKASRAQFVKKYGKFKTLHLVNTRKTPEESFPHPNTVNGTNVKDKATRSEVGSSPGTFTPSVLEKFEPMDTNLSGLSQPGYSSMSSFGGISLCSTLIKTKKTAKEVTHKEYLKVGSSPLIPSVLEKIEPKDSNQSGPSKPGCSSISSFEGISPCPTLVQKNKTAKLITHKEHLKVGSSPETFVPSVLGKIEPRDSNQCGSSKHGCSSISSFEGISPCPTLVQRKKKAKVITHKEHLMQAKLNKEKYKSNVVKEQGIDINNCVECKVNYFDKNGPNVDWIQCIICKKWLHETCTVHKDMCKKCFYESKKINRSTSLNKCAL